MRSAFDKRIVFFGGKGGVGKTTCASAAALTACRRGKRVLLVSTDPAHSTSDIFERPFGREEREVYPGLTGLELDGAFEAERYIESVKGQLGALFSPSIVKEAERQIDLAAGMPGVEEAALFERMGELIVNRLDAYDLVIFDTAPTGHTLRMLKMPDLMGAWIGALTRRRRTLMAAKEELERVGQSNDDERPPVEDPIMIALESRRRKLEEMKDRLMHPGVTGFVLVLIPERLPIEESARSAEALRAFNVNVCGVLVNRVLPEGLEGEFYAARRAQEQVYRDEISTRFAAYPLTWIPQFESDVVGIRNLERVSGVMGGGWIER